MQPAVGFSVEVIGTPLIVGTPGANCAALPEGEGEGLLAAFSHQGEQSVPLTLKVKLAGNTIDEAGRRLIWYVQAHVAVLPPASVALNTLLILFSLVLAQEKLMADSV